MHQAASLTKGVKKRLVTIHHAKPMQSPHVCSSSACVDTTAYKRSTERLITEFSRKSPDRQLLQQLLRETFKSRRNDIESSLQRTTILSKTYSFFASEELVCQIECKV